ncbi:MAG: ABC transporter permease [Anaerolineae bacterium]|jgi:peptide/nickel transport system permease protein|nr:ABC transporter permease [Anaerolineae bacterium]
MLRYILRRVGIMIPTLMVVSIVSFVIIQLPPGDFLSSYIAQLSMQGDYVDQDILDALERRYGMGQPIYVQYWKWISGIILRGDWGQSMEWEKPVKDLIWERIGLTMVLSSSTMLFSWLVSIPVGVYSATHQYSLLDYALSFVSFVGRGMPGFLLALIVMYFAMTVLKLNVGGLFSTEYILVPWSWAKFVDMAKHIWIAILILAFGSTAGLIRITRANTLDELRKPYVTTARAKGVKENRLILKYPVRVALNPFFSTVGWSLANLISGSTLVAAVLSLQTTGPMMLRALTSQDMYLAGSFLLLLSALTVIGTLLSDILLAWVDPRIRLGG